VLISLREDPTATAVREWVLAQLAARVPVAG